MPDFTLHDLQCFDAVVEAGGFQGAAQQLHRSHPAVFAAVARLERQLGFELLDRSGYRVALTAAGASFHRRAQGLLRELGSLRDHVAHLAAGEESELRVVLGDFCPRPALLEKLARFFATQPRTHLQLYFESVSGPLEKLLDGEAELILHRVDKADPRLEWLDLGTVDFIPVIAPTLLEGRGDIHPGQLRSLTQCVMRDSARHSPPVDYFTLDGAPQCTVPDQAMKKELVLHGLAWGHLPRHLIAEELADGRLRDLSGPHLPGRREELVAARLRDRAHGPVAQRLWSFLQQA
ncbi:MULTISPECIES: LysR family transcriptional regulator [Pseudomonas]|uniref:LysR family transcriptional regulator n=1 Tax=Pseudomonas nitroreducens TaxID=46680 RepID=A0A246FE38_PSENT|nr:LysR family transcriptional regulator [Pseudomonas sp.]MDU4252042.1 LysR family transcriptional regulator [Pseudomonas sp.]OWP52573.1 LysR family transcriptional regulator [Pseudomonas nitroreducens]